MSMSSKRTKFRHLAEKRVDRTLSAIRSIGSLSNADLYEWEPQEINEIMEAIREALAATEMQFNNPVTRGRHKFKLKTGGDTDDDIPF